MTRDDVGEALWQSRELVKASTLRTTPHLHPADDISLWTRAESASSAPVLSWACTPQVARTTSSSRARGAGSSSELCASRRAYTWFHVSVRTREDMRIAELPDYPFAPHRLDVDGLSMHYVDEGAGDPVLLLHGEPTWSFLWRKLVPPLVAAGRRVVAPDLIGFGRSDKPTEIGWYSYDRHVASIARLVEELDLRRLTLVLHDWGGPIGLRVAVEHEERVERLVILDTGIGAGGAPSETWLRFREVVRELGGELDIGRLVAAGTAQGLSDEVRAAYDAPFPTPESKAGALAFPELVPTELDHPNAVSMNRVRDALREWRKPALVVWGARDTVLPPRVAERFVELIPGASGPVLVEGASHFLQEDRPGEVAGAILQFLDD